MNKKSVIIGGAVLGIATLAFAASSGSSTFDSFVKKLGDAQSMDVSYTISQVGGSSAEYRVTLARPNKARIESPAKTIVADGETMTVFLSGQNVYYTKPQNDSEVRALVAEASNGIWALFFDSKSYAKAASVRDQGNRRIAGQDHRVVRIQEDQKGETITTLFVSEKDRVVKQATMESTFSGQKSTQILQAQSFKLDLEVGSETFAFKAPASAKKIEEADLIANKWFDNLEEAKQVARQTNRPLLVGFTAIWCGPCQMLKRDVYPTAQFKEAAKDFVLVTIDIDVQKDVAQRFEVTSIPNIIFMNADEQILNEFVGFRPAPAYVAEMRKALGR
ncbi:MAG: thioredoxin family protein [Fimbriimonadaceae bacterium]|jgi:thiol-disulfide isomerase/thioredoxin|nr:thioredoxin family protein [Fimbriimonadaceae bacterium]